MKRLIITRHAKSSWDNLNLSDHDRSLNKRGREATGLIGGWLKSKSYTPDQVLASTATRCMETWEGIGMAMECDAPVTYESGLYHSSADLILNFLHKAVGDTVLVTAHNPGVGEFASRIVRTCPDHPRFYGYPSGATTVVEFETMDWTQIAFGTGELLGFVVPSELK